jgi:tripartite-type tricarboxylate transporter receptor subunit TctC
MTRIISLMLSLLSIGAPARADAVSDFFHDKTVTIYIGYAVGGGYDIYARAIAKYISAHIPGNPRIIASNMPGASSMTLANFLAKVAPRDGTAIGAVNSALVFDPLFAGPQSKAQFLGPDLSMIGNVVSSASVLLSWTDTGVKTLGDIRQKGLTIGATSTTGDTYLLPLAIKNILGLDKLKIITGYPGTREAALALEQGEISGRVWDMEGIKASRPDWLRDRKITLIAQLAPKRMPEVPGDVPLVKDSVLDQSDRDALDIVFLSTILARPYIAPPEIPPDRLRALRDAFKATLSDPEFLAEIGKMKLTVDLTSGEDMQKIVENSYALPASTIEKVRRALSSQ